MAGKGEIIINPQWDMTDKRRVALEQLSALGVSVRSHVEESDFLIEIPLRTAYPEYIEIGYFIAQLGDENFPNLRFKESHPAFMQFVVKTKK
ncbi:MAG: hypothetical protein H0X30_13500 [Anaerolineae bacterium]|nr:hypothetical protein [Anaerolineae bacterium]